MYPIEYQEDGAAYDNGKGLGAWLQPVKLFCTFLVSLITIISTLSLMQGVGWMLNVRSAKGRAWLVRNAGCVQYTCLGSVAITQALEVGDFNPSDLFEVATFDTTVIVPEDGVTASTHDQIRLHYFDSYGRAEPIRMMLAKSEIDWKDCRVSLGDWPDLKPKYGTLPSLEFADGTIVR
jgi:hypothetical protein